MGVIHSLHHLWANIIDLDVLASDWIADCPAVISLGLLGVVSLDLALTGFVLLPFGIDLGVSLPLILVQALHELLNVGNPVGARIVARRRLVFLLLHVAYICNRGRREFCERKYSGGSTWSRVTITAGR